MQRKIDGAGRQRMRVAKRPAGWRKGKYGVWACVTTLLLALLPAGAGADSQKADTKQIDASDPTRIVTFLGIGPKTTDYTDNSRINEVRLAATVGLGAKDMVIAEVGYGYNTGDDESGLTNTQLRHFHLFEMDNDVQRGYRGWGSSIDVNLAGSLRGMDGQNMISVGASPAFALGNDWQLYPIAMVVNSWDKRFSNYNGGGINLSPLLTKKLGWWDGAFISFWLQYNRFFWGNLEGNGGGQMQFTLSGKFTPTLIWRLQAFSMFDKDFRGYDRTDGFDPRPRNAFFFRVESYF